MLVVWDPHLCRNIDALEKVYHRLVHLIKLLIKLFSETGLHGRQWKDLHKIVNKQELKPNIYGKITISVLEPTGVPVTGGPAISWTFLLNCTLDGSPSISKDTNHLNSWNCSDWNSSRLQDCINGMLKTRKFHVNSKLVSRNFS